MTQNVVLYTVEINIENPDKLLLPYLTANVRFVLSREANALLVPNAALRWAPSSLAQIAPDVAPGQPSAERTTGDPPAGGPAPSQETAAEVASAHPLAEGRRIRPARRGDGRDLGRR